MVSFESDYNNGMLPEILQRLAETNNEKCSGYGFDAYTVSAKEKIRKAVGIEDADVTFLVGGTQTNSVVIDALLMGCEGALTIDTGHIEVHEAGAIEAFGHKVITLQGKDSKMTPEVLTEYMERFLGDDTYPHMVQPGLVYISMPTELGMVYTRNELTALYAACKKYNLLLYVDGARLGYGLAAATCDYDLKFLAAHCDVFYIGGTKVGAMMGEAVVFTNRKAPKYFFTTVKRHGALLAKGRMLGLQFDTLFTDNLYLRVGHHAISMAERLKEIFIAHHIPFAVASPTNQQFVVLSQKQFDHLSRHLAFGIWERRSADEIVCRFVTSWATTDEDLEVLEKACGEMESN